MDGLEAVEIKFDEAFDDNDSFRFDSEYFKKEFLKEDRLRERFNNTALNSVAFITDGQHGYHEVDESSEILHLTAKNAKGWFADSEGADRLAKWVDDNNKRSSLQENDIILSTRGSVGYCAIVKEDVLPANIDQDVARIALNADNDIFPEFLLTYLNSKVGQDWMLRNSSGMVQQGLPLSKVRDLPLPVMSEVFQKSIKKIINLAFDTKQSSKNSYQEAENILLEHLGLKDWQPGEAGVSVKSFADSFGTSARLDAEHYQPKYEALEQKLGEFESLKLGDLVCYPVASGSTPKAGGDAYTDEEQGIPFIRAVDLKNSRVSTDNFIYVKPEIHNGILKKTRLKKNDVLFSIAGTVGRCALFEHNFAANINQAVSILRFDEQQLKRLYVTTFFNSEIGKLYVSKYSRQGLQTNLNLDEVGSLSVPLLDIDIQEQIVQKVEASFHSEALSKNLLETAKRGVELAIEESEAAALTWLEAQLAELGLDLSTAE